MATKKEKEELVEILKFTPQKVVLSLWGYGGEIAYGKINKEQFDYWKDKDESEVIEHCTAFDEEDNAKIPEAARFIRDGAWYDSEGLLDHMSGCEFNGSNHITVEPETGDTIFDEKLDYDDLETLGVEISGDESFASSHDDVEYYYCFQSTEKGTFFSAEFTLKAPFDPKKLKIETMDVEGWDLVSSVSYDGEELEGMDGYDTTGKGYYCSINEV